MLGLGARCPHKLLCLSTGPPGGAVIWEGCGTRSKLAEAEQQVQGSRVRPSRLCLHLLLGKLVPVYRVAKELYLIPTAPQSRLAMASLPVSMASLPQ